MTINQNWSIMESSSCSPQHYSGCIGESAVSGSLCWHTTGDTTEETWGSSCACCSMCESIPPVQRHVCVWTDGISVLNCLSHVLQSFFGHVTGQNRLFFFFEALYETGFSGYIYIHITYSDLSLPHLSEEILQFQHVPADYDFIAFSTVWTRQCLPGNCVYNFI